MTRTLIVIAGLTLSATAFAGGEHCDQAASTETAEVDVAKAEGTKVALAVSGMTCGACSDKVTAALKKIEGVNAVSVDHETGRADVAFDEKKTNTEAMIAAITALDFKAEVEKDEARKEG